MIVSRDVDVSDFAKLLKGLLERLFPSSMGQVVYLDGKLVCMGYDN